MTTTDTNPNVAELRQHAEYALYETQRAQRQRVVEAAGSDIATLRAKLAEFGITPLAKPEVTDNGTVRVLIYDLDRDTVGDDIPEARKVWARIDGERIRLEAIPIDSESCFPLGDAGPLSSLADLGRAIADGPRPSAALPRTHAEHARRAAHSYDEPHAGLIHAVLAVADALDDLRAALP